MCIICLIPIHRTVRKFSILNQQEAVKIISYKISGLKSFWYLPWKLSTYALRALRAHLLFSLWTFSLCIHCKTKPKKVRELNKNFLWIFKFNLVRSHLHEIWARSVQSFWRLLDTNGQTDKYIQYIDEIFFILWVKVFLLDLRLSLPDFKA